MALGLACAVWVTINEDQKEREWLLCSVVPGWHIKQGLGRHIKEGHAGTQVVVGLGLLAATGYAVRQYLAPRAAQWLREWRGDAAKAQAEQAAAREKSAQLVAAAVAAQVRSWRAGCC